MSDQSARLGLPYLAAGQMQKHVTLNETLTRLDALVQTCVVSRTEAIQPDDAEEGALHILPSGATGADWSGFDAGDLVRFEMDGWTRVEVGDGLVALLADEGAVVVRHDGGWSGVAEGLDELNDLTRLGVGTTADGTNPLAAKINKALFTAKEVSSGGDGDLRITLNKETSADVL